MFFCTLFLIFLDSDGTNIRLCVLSLLHKPMFIFVFNHFPLCYSDWRIYIALSLSSPFCHWMNLVKTFCFFSFFFIVLLRPKLSVWSYLCLLFLCRNVLSVHSFQEGLSLFFCSIFITALISLSDNSIIFVISVLAR